MATPGQRVPVNLTALAEARRLPGPGPGAWTAGEAAGRTLEVRLLEACTLEAWGPDRAGEVHPGGMAGDAVYVIAAGYGLLRCGEAVLECTAGDVLLVPGGQPHHFEAPEGGIGVWRISATGHGG